MFRTTNKSRFLPILILCFLSTFVLGCSSFNYQVKVVESGDADKKLKGAKVTIQVGGLAPLRETTDNEGIAIIPIDSSRSGELGRVIVELEGYEAYDLHVNLNENELPEQIPLVRAGSIPPTPTEEPPAESTEEPTVEHTTEPTEEVTSGATEEPTEPTSEPTGEPIVVTIMVRSKDTGNEIAEALATLNIGGQTLFSNRTDSDGSVTISIDSSNAGQAGELLVEAEGYKSYSQDIKNLNEDALPDVIELEPEAFDYTIQILEDDEDTGVENANVSIQVEGEESLEETTNSGGLTTISIDFPYINQAGELLVEAEGYKSYSQNIESLNEDALPEIIQLEMDQPIVVEPTPPTGRLAIPLMFGDQPKVYLVNTNGNLIRDVDGARQPDFTQDGTRLIVNGDGEFRMLFMTDRDGEFINPVGDPGLTEHTHPAWSPDGTQVIYDDGKIAPPDWHAYKRKLDDNQGPGEELLALSNRSIVDNHPLHPLWTTNNRFIFRSCNTWASAGGGGTCGLWMMQGNGGEPIQLTGNPNHIPTDVHGGIVVYTFKADVYLLDITGGSTEQLTFDPANDGLATISPDGGWVAFLSNRGGRLAVWYRSLNQGPPQHMFDIPTEGSNAWGTLGPDGWFDERLSWGK